MTEENQSHITSNNGDVRIRGALIDHAHVKRSTVLNSVLQGCILSGCTDTEGNLFPASEPLKKALEEIHRLTTADATDNRTAYHVAKVAAKALGKPEPASPSSPVYLSNTHINGEPLDQYLKRMAKEGGLIFVSPTP